MLGHKLRDKDSLVQYVKKSVKKNPLSIRKTVYRGKSGYSVRGEYTKIFFTSEQQAIEYVRRVKAGEHPQSILMDIWGLGKNPAPQVAPVSSRFVGHWIKPDGWDWGSVLRPGLKGFCEYYLPVQSKGPIKEVAVNVKVTGRTNVIRGGLVVRRCLITFAGDHELSIAVGGWLEVYPGYSG